MRISYCEKYLKGCIHVIPLSSSFNQLRKPEKYVSFSALLCCGDHFETYFENCIEVDKVLEGCPIKMDHFGVLPTLLGLCTFSEKLLTTLFELWITGLSWKQKLDKSTKTCLFAQLYLRPSGHWVKCLWSHSLVWSFWPWFLIVSFWWRWLLLTAQSLLCLLFTGSGRKYSLCGQFCWWHCWIEWRGREKKGVLW